MPVVINELVVRVTVESPGTVASGQPGAPLSAEERAAIVEAAVQETLRILRNERER